jgi:hypothetical protein
MGWRAFKNSWFERDRRSRHIGAVTHQTGCTVKEAATDNPLKSPLAGY